MESCVGVLVFVRQQRAVLQQRDGHVAVSVVERLVHGRAEIGRQLARAPER